MAQPLIFYDLVAYPGGPVWSPKSAFFIFWYLCSDISRCSTWKTRFSFLHKGVDFVTKEISWHDLRTTIREQTGMDRPVVPLIKLPDGTWICDSFRIAEYVVPLSAGF